MYCPDTYKRINDAKVAEYQAQLDAEKDAREEQEEMGKEGPDEPDVESTKCEFCDDNWATQVIPVYNPADKINGRGQEAYAVYHICDECVDTGKYMDENFFCDGCGEMFIYNHSWEVLAVTKDEGIFCQSCAAEAAEECGVYLCDLLDVLCCHSEKSCSRLFQKLDNMPGKTLLWAGAFSEYSDFPGFTSFRQVGQAIAEAAEEAELSAGAMVWPLVTACRQFNVTLAVYY